MQKEDIKQIIIYFKENLSNGFSLPREKQVAIYLDIPFRRMQLEILSGNGKSKSIYNHDNFQPMVDKTTDFIDDIANYESYPNIRKIFNNIGEYDCWRQNVWFKDCDVNWKIFVEMKDGTLHLFLDTNSSLPSEIEKVYRIAEKMNVEVF